MCTAHCADFKNGSYVNVNFNEFFTIFYKNFNVRTTVQAGVAASRTYCTLRLAPSQNLTLTSESDGGGGGNGQLFNVH